MRGLRIDVERTYISCEALIYKYNSEPNKPPHIIMA